MWHGYIPGQEDRHRYQSINAVPQEVSTWLRWAADICISTTCNRSYPASHDDLTGQGEYPSSTTNADMAGALLHAVMGLCISVQEASIYAQREVRVGRASL